MMNNKYLLTVIIPVYNTEKYIKRCIDSILNQSFKYIKIIIINDNSTDRSSSIIHKFSSYEQVKIIENSYNIGQGESFQPVLSFRIPPSISYTWSQRIRISSSL